MRISLLLVVIIALFLTSCAQRKKVMKHCEPVAAKGDIWVCEDEN